MGCTGAHSAHLSVSCATFPTLYTSRKTYLNHCGLLTLNAGKAEADNGHGHGNGEEGLVHLVVDDVRLKDSLDLP